MTDITIPREAQQSVKSYLKAAFGGRYNLDDLDWDTVARAACLAMIRNWPGMSVAPIPRFRPYQEAETLPHIILPLPQESGE